MIDGCHIDGRSRVGYTERNEFLDEKLRMETMDLARGVRACASGYGTIQCPRRAARGLLAASPR